MILCIISPATIIVLSMLSDAGQIALSEGASTFIGVAVMFVLVGIGVPLFIAAGAKTREFKHIEEEEIDTEYGVDGFAKKQRAQFATRRLTSTIAGICLIFLAALTFAGSGILEDDLGPMSIVGIAFGLVPVALGVACFVHSGIIEGAFKQLLQEDDYSPHAKSADKKISPIVGAYWLLTVAIYLSYSLVTDDWTRSWVIWPVAGVLCGALAIILSIVFARDNRPDESTA